MEKTNSFLSYTLYHFPIVQLVQIIVISISLPPVLILLTRISKIALHDNCKLLLIAWNSAFLACLCVHCAYIGCDFVTGKFIPESNHDPPVRLLLFAIQGFFHAMSSAQELMLSIERAISSKSPEEYHNRSLSKRAVFLAEIVSVVIATFYSWIISKSANPNYLALSCCLINTVDLASIICLSITTRYIAKRKQLMANSSLNNKYQIIEALKVTQVMLPCGVISIVMKISSSLAAWTYVFNLIDSKYMFTITGTTYFIIESLNCMLCTTYILWNHDGLRRSTLELLRFKNDFRTRDQQSAKNVQDLYFDALRKDRSCVMRSLQPFILILLVHNVQSFVYSCEEVLYKLMNSTFEQYTKYAYVFTEEGFTNWEQLDNIFLTHGDTLYSFAFMADNHCVNMEDETRPWTIVADNPSLSCDQEFTLILKSDETKLVIPRLNAINKFFDGSGVFVVPQAGMLLEKMSMSGEGTISFYSGAGTGEDEERYLLQSWKCSSMPNRIFSFESVITIVADDSCSYMLQYISNFDRCEYVIGWVILILSDVNIFRNDRVAILSSGRNSNLQNRKNGTELITYIEIGEWQVSENHRDINSYFREKSNVTINMNLNFDSENTGSIGLMEQFSGPIDPYYNGTYKLEFFTDYFEIRWNPKELEPFEISKNQDNINIDIQVSHSNDEFECPDGYELIFTADEHWCFTIFGPIPPNRGFTFLEAGARCLVAGDSLPIVTSRKMNLLLAKFIYDFDVIEEVWLGLFCNPDECSDSINVGIDKNIWRTHERHGSMGKTVCSRRAQSQAVLTTTALSSTISDSDGLSGSTEAFTTTTVDTTSATSIAVGTSTENTQTSTATSSTSTYFSTLTSSNSPTTSAVDKNSGPPAWEIALIVIGIILAFGCAIGIFLIVRRRRRLKDQLFEEKFEIRKISQQAYVHYGIESDSEDEWEIDRRFVGIDYMNKLGEGAFGCVFLGRVLAKNIPSAMGRSVVELSSLTNHNDTVAVKMLHENADSQIERDFMSEIELMKRIGYHERLVNMLACVTASRPILLICEYCANGDLLGFLRRRRKFMLEHPEKTESVEVITVKKQLMFAIQIAYGLEFLSSRGFIHRDVAARNVMVDQNEGCKIGDFGLGRSIGRENEHYHAQGGKLPLKWMSPEALDKYHFSSAADVWSYGVLLYEIVTLGGVPYAGWPAIELLSRLKRGERMEMPDNCSEKLFEIMCECWSEQPSDRPTFEILRKELGDLLENVHRDDYYLKLNAHANYYVLESQASE